MGTVLADGLGDGLAVATPASGVAVGSMSSSTSVKSAPRSAYENEVGCSTWVAPA